MSILFHSIEPISVQGLSQLLISNDDRHNETIKSEKIIRSKLFYIGMIINLALPIYQWGALMTVFTTMEKNIISVFNWSAEQSTLYLSLANFATMFVGILSNFFISRFRDSGRRKMIIYFLLLTPIGCVCTMIVWEPIFILGRCLQGLTFGALSIIPPTMIREFATKEYKGLCAVLLPLIYRLGTAVQYGLGFYLPEVQNDPSNGYFRNQYWRFMLGAPAIVVFINVGLFLFVWRDESPNYVYLNTNKDKEKTMKILLKYFYPNKAEQEYQSIVYVNSKKTDSSSDLSLLEVIKTYPKQLIIAIGMVVGYTVNGFSVIVVYSNDILEQAGMSNKQATLFTFISLSGDLLGLSIGTMLLQVCKRKRQFLVSMFLVIVTDIVFGLLVYGHQEELYKYNILLFRVFYSAGISSVIWGYIPDILPLNGVNFTFAIESIVDAATVLSYMSLKNAFRIENVFLGYGVFTFLLWLLLARVMKETKGLNKDEILRLFENNQNHSIQQQFLSIVEQKQIENKIST